MKLKFGLNRTETTAPVPVCYMPKQLTRNYMSSSKQTHYGRFNDMKRLIIYILNDFDGMLMSAISCDEKVIVLTIALLPFFTTGT